LTLRGEFGRKRKKKRQKTRGKADRPFSKGIGKGEHQGKGHVVERDPEGETEEGAQRGSKKHEGPEIRRRSHLKPLQEGGGGLGKAWSVGTSMEQDPPGGEKRKKGEGKNKMRFFSAENRKEKNGDSRGGRVGGHAAWG